jgi:hypothetical protein
LPSVRLLRWAEAPGFTLFGGEHDGYARLPLPVIHRRWVFGLDTGLWLIRDLALGEGSHSLDLFWRIAPFLRVDAVSPEIAALNDGGETLALLAPEGDGWVRTLGQGEWSPAYGAAEPAPVLRFSRQTRLPAETALLILPAGACVGATRGRVRRTGGSDAGAAAYRYTAGSSEVCMFFREQLPSWSLDEWASDALFMYAVLDAGRPCRIGFVDGSYVEYAGRRLVNSGSCVPVYDAAV